MEGILTMSQKEIDRLSILKQVDDKKLTVEEASEIIGLSERQTYRVLKRIRDEGSKGIIHKLRGRKSNRGYPEQLKRKIITLCRRGYPDYGPTLYAEKLIENH
jgi:transposase